MIGLGAVLMPARNLVFRKKSATVGQFSKLKNFNKKTKVHTLFSGKWCQPLNYSIHDSGLHGKGSRVFLNGIKKLVRNAL